MLAAIIGSISLAVVLGLAAKLAWGAWQDKKAALARADARIAVLSSELELWPQRLKDERSSLEAAVRVLRSERDHYSKIYSDIAIVAAKESPAALRAFVAERLLRATQTAGEADPGPEAGVSVPAPAQTDP